MRQLPVRPILVYSLALLLCASLLVACSQEDVVPPAPRTVIASGLVYEMPLQTPLAGATVQLISNEFYIDDPHFVRTCDCEGDLCNYWTTSDGQGNWSMEVPVKYNDSLAPFNMLMKVSTGNQSTPIQPFSARRNETRAWTCRCSVPFSISCLAWTPCLAALTRTILP